VADLGTGATPPAFGGVIRKFCDVE